MKTHDTSLFSHFQRLQRDGSITLASLGIVGYTLWMKYRRLRTVSLHAIALIWCVAGGPIAAQTASPPSIVVRSGTPAPDGSSYVIDSVVTPIINSSGQIAFRTSTSAGSGIFAGAPGALQTVASLGAAAPAGGNYNVLNFAVMNSGGHVAFNANTTVNGAGIFARTLGFPGTTAALVGTASPTGDNYSAVTAIPVINPSGQVALLANLNTAGAGDQGIFVGTPGTTLTTAALLGNPAPAGGNYQQLTSPAINSAGKVLFRASLTIGYGLFFGAPGTTLTTVAHSSSTTPAGGVFGVFSSTPVVNSAGQVAFVTDRNGDPNSGIFAGIPGTTLTTVGIQGNAAPAGGNYNNFGNPALNAAGQVAFLSNLSGGSSNRGIFVGTPGQTLETIALHGSAAPNASGTTYSGLSNPSLNASGQVAFTSILTGDGVNFSNNFGLFAGSPGNVLQIVRTGDLVDIDPTEGVSNRLVSSITFLSTGGNLTDSGGQDGRISSFNDSGDLVYRLDFTNGERAIFMSNLAPVSTPGDFNGDGTVDGHDFLAWQRGDSPNPLSAGNLADWQANYGAGPLVAANVAVPEPATFILLMMATAGGWGIRRTA